MTCSRLREDARQHAAVRLDPLDQPFAFRSRRTPEPNDVPRRHGVTLIRGQAFE